MKVSRIIFLLFYLPTIVFLCGCCIAISNFQSPKTLSPGKKEFGIGVVGSINNEGALFSMLQFDVHSRFGITQRLDIGAKLYSARGLGAYGDVKYELIKRTVALSIVQGISFSYSHVRAQPTDLMTDIIGIYTTFLLGNERFYIGYKSLAEINGLISGQASMYQFPGFLLGMSFGNKLRLRSEIGYSPESPRRYSSYGPFVFGIGLMYRI